MQSSYVRSRESAASSVILTPLEKTLIISVIRNELSIKEEDLMPGGLERGQIFKGNHIRIDRSQLHVSSFKNSLKHFYLFIWLHWVLVAVCGI